jgi:hypothetical protein
LQPWSGVVSDLDAENVEHRTAPDEVGQDAVPARSGISVLGEHLTLVIAGVGVAVVAVRILGIARGDLITANILVAGTSAAPVALSTALNMLAIAICVWVMTLIGIRRMWPDAPEVLRPTTARVIAATVLAVCFVPVLYLIAAVVAGLVSLGFGQGSEKEGGARFLIDVASGVVALAVLGSLVLPPFWPAQRVEIDGRPRTAYIVGSEVGRTTVLLDSPRRAIIVESSRIGSTVVCQRGKDVVTKSLVAIVLGQGEYPTC